MRVLVSSVAMRSTPTNGVCTTTGEVVAKYSPTSTVNSRPSFSTTGSSG